MFRRPFVPRPLVPQSLVPLSSLSTPRRRRRARRRLTTLLLTLAWSATDAARAEPTASGTVFGPGEAGLAGARVELLPLHSSFESGHRRLARDVESRPLATATTDPAGRFRLRAPEAGVFRVVVGASGYLPVQILPLALTGARELPPVTLRGSHQTVIRVTDPRGRPFAGAWVFARAADEARRNRENPSPWRAAVRLGLTGIAGSLELPKADGETLEVTVFTSQAPPVRAQLDGDLLSVAVEPGHRRALRVVDRHGEPMAGVLARIGPLAWSVATTAADGLLRWPAQLDQEVSLRLFTADGRQQAVTLAATGPDASPDEVVLPAALTVHGRVLSAANRPLAGAVVWPGPDPGAFVRTDADGRYSLIVPTRERLWLQAESAGHVPRLVRVRAAQLAARRVPTLALPGAVTIAGQVVDAAGREVTGAWLAAVPRARGLRAFSSPDPADGRDLTSGGGGFALDGLQPGQAYTLIASRPGSVPTTVDAFAPVAGGPTPRVKIVLAAGRPAVGRVVDLDERPVAEADVVLAAHAVETRALTLPATGEQDPFRARTDTDGRFRLAAVPGDLLDVNVAAADYAPMTVRRVPVAGGDGVADLGTFVMVPGVAITGKVQDAAERPIPDAAIHVFAAEAGERGRRGGTRVLGLERRRPQATSAADGSFAVDDLPAGGRRSLWVRAEGYLPAHVGSLEAPNAEPILVVLERGVSAAGRVVDAAGEGLAGAVVDLSWRDLLPGAEREIPVGPRETVSTLSGADGSFELNGLKPGKASLGVEAERFVIPDPRELEIPAGGIADLTLILERGTVVTGRVLDDRDDPIAGVRVTAGGNSARTDPEGFYRVEGARAGPDRAHAFHPHYGRFDREVEIDPGGATLDWTLPAGHEVSGRAVDGAERPVADAAVRLTLRDPHRPRTYSARSGADGSFVFATVAEGSYTLSAEARGYAPQERGDAVVVAAESVSGVEITLERGVVVRGEVLGLDFDDLARVRVEARQPQRSIRGRVDYEGRFEVAELPPGSWLLSATLDGGRRQAQARLWLSPGAGDVVQDLEFGGGLTLSGRVLHNGEPLAGAAVDVRGRQAAVERSVTTDYQGGFRFADLDRGDYWLGVSHVRERLVHNDVLRLDADLDVTLDVRHAAVRGTVGEAGSGRLLADAAVTLKRHGAGEGLMVTATDGEGRFSQPRVPAGSYSVTARKDGYAPARSEIEVAAGRDVEGLAIELEPTQGLDLWVSLASGKAPSQVAVMVRGADAGVLLAEPRPTSAEGKVRLSTVPPGDWEVLVSAVGGALTASRATVPADGVSLVLPPAGRLRVQVPGLRTSTRVASLSLLGAGGARFIAIDLAARGLRDRWPLVGGAAAVDGVPAGVWTVEVETPDGTLRTQTVVTHGADLEVVLN